jgi:hypothetical protein
VSGSFAVTKQNTIKKYTYNCITYIIYNIIHNILYIILYYICTFTCVFVYKPCAIKYIANSRENWYKGELNMNEIRIKCEQGAVEE